MSKSEIKTRGRPRTVDRDRTIEIVMNIYWEKGLFTLSLNEICRLAKISKPTLYREFGGEDGLIVAVLDSYRERFVLPLLEALTSKQPFPITLNQAIVALTSNRGTPLGCLFTKMRLVNSRLGHLAKERVRVFTDEQLSAYEAWYKSGLSRNEVNSDLSSEFAARYLDIQFATILVMMSEGISPEFIREHAFLALGALLNT